MPPALRVLTLGLVDGCPSTYASAFCPFCRSSDCPFASEARAAPDVRGLGSRFGLKRARLALVGEMKEGRVGVRMVNSCSEKSGDVLRRFGDGDVISIFEWTGYGAEMQTR